MMMMMLTMMVMAFTLMMDDDDYHEVGLCSLITAPRHQTLFFGFKLGLFSIW